MTAPIEASLVSTIIPVYNRPKMMRAAVDSVLAQTHRPVEVILADDGSTDDTPRVAAELVAQHQGTVRLEQSGGPVPAPDRGLDFHAERSE
ncbi:MAG: glycosyltransferase family 2 protein, partial [Planctomycetota bacterium]